jgi:ankyrin repeat protein
MSTWNPLIHIIVKASYSELDLNSNASYIHSPTEYGSTPLHFAALRKDIRFVQYLLRKGVGINTTNDFEETPLHWAVKQGHKESVALLIANGANVDSLDSEDKSPKDWAVEENQTHLFTLLALLKPQKGKVSTFLSLRRPFGRHQRVTSHLTL